MALALRRWPPQEVPLPPYSIRAHYNSSSGVLLTGATGFVGSLVLEKLLRSTDCQKVFVLLRPRRGFTPSQRLAHLLRSPLFHRLRPSSNETFTGSSDASDTNPRDDDSRHSAGVTSSNLDKPRVPPTTASSRLCSIDPAVLARVVVVPGDILLPGLGLSEADVAMLSGAVDTVIHAAADIRLEAHIHDTLRANFSGTLAVINLATQLPRLQAVVHVSTCYTNIDRPRGSTVQERLYPLCIAGSPIDPSALASELLAMSPSEASARAATLIDYLGLRNTYALGKRLAEAAVVQVAQAQGLPLAVLRPSLVSAVAWEPYPGFAGNAAGLVGASLAYITGLYNDNPAAVAADADSVWDVVPGDLVAHAIIATAAATAKIHRLRSATAVCGPTDPADAITNTSISAPGDSMAASLHHLPTAAPLLVVQAATSTTYPITTADIANTCYAFVGAHRRPWTLTVWGARPMAHGQRWDAAAWRRNQWWSQVKVRLAVGVCRLLGFARAARLLEGGFATLVTINHPQYDLNLAFSTNNLCALEASLSPEERKDFLLIWRPPSPGSVNNGDEKQKEADTAGVVTTAGVTVDQQFDETPGSGVGGPQPQGSSRRSSSSAGGGGSGLNSSSWGRCSDEAGNGSGSDGGGETLAAVSLLPVGPATDSAASALALNNIGVGTAGWRVYQNTMLAFLYFKLFGAAVPREAAIPPVRLQALRGALPVRVSMHSSSSGVSGSSSSEQEWGPRVMHHFTPLDC